jgi:hypothetical protein
MGRNPNDRPGRVSVPDGIQTVTRQTRDAAIELLIRFRGRVRHATVAD